MSDKTERFMQARAKLSKALEGIQEVRRKEIHIPDNPDVRLFLKGLREFREKSKLISFRVS